MPANSTLEEAILNFIASEPEPAPAVVGLPTDAKARKALPVYSGVLRYFPLAIAKVSDVSRVGGEQHAPGEPLTWKRDLSTDQLDADARHTLDLAILDNAGEGLSDEAIHVLAQKVWRDLAELQIRLEKRGGI